MRLIFTSILYLLLNVHVNCTSYSLNTTRKDEKTRSLLTKRKLPEARVWCSNGRYCNMPSGYTKHMGSCQWAKMKKLKETAGYNEFGCGDCPLGYFAKAKREVDWQGKLLERRRPGSSYVQYSYSESCTSCSEGQYSSDPVNSRFECKSCEAGTVAEDRGSSTCFPCPAGFREPYPGKVRCDSCPNGQYQDDSNEAGNTACKKCQAGYFQGDSDFDADVQIAILECTECPTGFYQDQERHASCNSCPDDLESNVAATYCFIICDPGAYLGNTEQLHNTNCEQCDPGKYSVETAATSSSACKNCPEGQFSSGKGNGECTSCTAGFYQNEQKQTSCKPCPEYYQSADEAFMENKVSEKNIYSYCFKLCEPGSYLGSFSTKNVHNNNCVQCDQGQYGDETAATSATACKDCPTGQYSSGRGNDKCTICQVWDGVGRFQDKVKKSSCKDCPQGMYGPMPTFDTKTGYKASNDNGGINIGEPFNVPSMIECGERCVRDHLCECVTVTSASDDGISCWLQKSCVVENMETNNNDYDVHILTYRSGLSCKSCDSGRAQPQIGQDICSKCGSGKYSGQSGSTECVKCIAGKFNSGTEKQSCENCPEGRFSEDEGESSCRKCPPGYSRAAWSAENIGDECFGCEPGQYNDGTQLISSTCIDCPVGYFREGEAEGEEATSCQACPAMTQPTEIETDETADDAIDRRSYLEGACKNCQAGERSSGGSELCSNCPANTYLNHIESFNTDELIWDVDDCNACDGGGTGCRDLLDLTGCRECDGCAAGKYGGADQIDCQDCEKGQYAGGGAVTCTLCPAGWTGTDEIGAQKCSACPIGKYRIGEGGQTLNECLDCDEGKYGTTRAAESALDCTDCAKGRYRIEKGANHIALCLACPAGSRSNVDGRSTVCSVCDPGYYSENPAETQNCKECLGGSYTTNSGRSSCSPCLPGRFQPLNKMPNCNVCLAGFFADELNSKSCLACPSGYIQPSEKSASCLPCMPGRHATSSGKSICDECDIGRYIAISKANVSCIACPNGFVQADKGASQCSVCAVGSVQNFTGHSACIDCDPGYVQPEVGESVCIVCPAGFSQVKKGQPTCIKCPLGKKQPEIGSVNECIDCDVHYFASTTKSITCTPCPIGYQQIVQGGSNCLKCSAGKFGESEKSSCIDCSAGKFRESQSIGSSCEECHAGFYQPRKASSSCLACIPGKATDLVGAITCVPCSVNSFSEETNSTSCSQCLSGQFTNQRQGSASCQYCPGGTAGKGCVPCIPGKYRGTTDPSDTCLLCKAGLASIIARQPFCLDCDAGKFAIEDGTDNCQECQAGRYQDEKRAKTQCKFCLEQTQIPNKLTSATGCEVVPVDHNAAIAALVSIQVISSDAKSLELTYRFSKPSTSTSDRLIEIGDMLEVMVSTRTDFKISYIPILVPMIETEPGNFESIEFSFPMHSTSNKTMLATDGKTQLHGLGSAWAILRYFRVRIAKPDGGRGPLATRNDAWIVSDKCSDEMYLSTHPNNNMTEHPLALVYVEEKVNDAEVGDNNDDTNDDKTTETTETTETTGSLTMVPRCMTCPIGSNCRGARTFSQIVARQGYRALPWNNRKYGECPRAIACPGNDITIQLPIDSFQFDGGNSSKLDAPCSRGHQSIFCGECQPYFDTKIGDIKGLCEACPNEQQNIIRIGILTVSIIAILAFLVRDSLDGIDEIAASVDEGNDAEVPFHSVALRIISSFMQVAGLLNNFRLNLPDEIVTLMTVMQTTSGVGGAVISFNCLLPITRGIPLFVAKLTTTVVILPMILAILVIVFWCFHSCFCHKKSKSGAGSMDKMIGSMLVLYYLTFPSMLQGMTQAMSCTTYGPRNDPVSKVLLDGALDVECYGNDHIAMLSGVVIPSFFVFVVIVPFLVVYSMHREYLGHRLLPHQNHFNPISCYRYGFLFLGYEQEFYGFEILVMLRKAAFVVASGLLRPYGPTAQVVGASCILIFALSIHLQHRPYDSDGHDSMESFSLHASLAILMSVLICSKVGSTADGNLGPTSSILLIIVVFTSVITFFYISVSHITKHSHNNKGILGKLSRCLTKKAINDRRHSVAAGENQPAKFKRGSTINNERIKFIHGSSKVVPKTSFTGRGLTMDLVNKAVIEHKLVKFEKAHDEQHAKSLELILERKKAASSRVRQRLINRRNSKNINNAPATLQFIQRTKKEATKEESAEIESVRQMLKEKIGTYVRLKKMFLKLDVEHSGLLTKKEFAQMLTIILKVNMAEKKINILWEECWEQRKHGGADEMDATTLAHWLDIRCNQSVI